MGLCLLQVVLAPPEGIQQLRRVYDRDLVRIYPLAAAWRLQCESRPRLRRVPMVCPASSSRVVRLSIDTIYRLSTPSPSVLAASKPLRMYSRTRRGDRLNAAAATSVVTQTRPALLSRLA